MSRAVGWLKEAIPGELHLKELNQAIHQHIESILTEMMRSGLIRAEEDKFALAKGECSESAA